MASKLEVNRGTTYTINGVYKEDGVATDITGATVRFTVKSEEYDSDTADDSALILKNVTSFSNPTAGEYAIVIDPADTQSIAPGKYFYSIKIELTSGAVYELSEGKFILDADPTNRLT
jgi:hypothetical protein